MQAIVFTGLQASGKSTFYRDNFADTHVRVNLDMLSASKAKEKKLIAACVEGKIPCVIDNTNLTAEHRKRYVDFFAPAEFKLISYHFHSDIKQCLLRNEARTDKKPVPNVALYTGVKKLTSPALDEGFTELYSVDICPDAGGFVVQSLTDEAVPQP